MEIFLLLVVMAAVGLLFFKGRQMADHVDELRRRVARLETDLTRARTERPPAPAQAPHQAAPPPLPPEMVRAPAPTPAAPVAPSAAAEKPIRLPPLIQPPPPAPVSIAPPPRRPLAVPTINWEQFLGVKLFAWLGGLALFLGVAFFVKYSFEHNLIPAAVRVAIGYLVGLGLIVGGLFLPRVRHAVTVQTLCATGIVILYANVFASHAYYKFIGPGPTFALMTLVTAAAFLLAVRLDAQVVAILGLLGGFLTPPMLSTGVDRPLGLFGYIALLDAGLLAVALRKRWQHLVMLAAVATVIMQFGWVGKFFAAEKLFTALGVFLAFTVLFTAALGVAHRLGQVEKWLAGAAVIPPVAALIFVFHLLTKPYAGIAAQPVVLFGFVFLIDAAFFVMAWWRPELRWTQAGAGLAVFGLLTLWTAAFLTPALLNAALGFYLLLAALHSVLPLALHRRRPAPIPMGWVHLAPVLALALVMVPLFKLGDGLSLLLWPVVLLIDLVAIGLAVLTGALVSILAVFLLTVVATAVWIFRVPADVTQVPGMLVVIGGFAAFFLAAVIFASRRVKAKFGDGWGTAGTIPPKLMEQIAALAAALPFLLLTLVTLRLALDNPSSVFGLGALLIVLLLGVVRLYRVDLLAAVGLASVLMLEYAWHGNRFMPERAWLALGWYLGFSAMFLVFPFVFRAQREKRLIPWATAALALPLHFFVIYRAMKLGFPAFAYPGLLPAALALPCLGALVMLVRGLPAEASGRNALLALFGGATLFFVTLIFPVQLDRQWITIGWALEGVALLWFFHRVPHPGLRWVGVALLVAVFGRLALNPWVFLEYGRSGRPILNWYLYSYGLVTAGLMAGGWLLAPPRHRLGRIHGPAVLYSLGTILAFILVNIEIADYFTGAGDRLRFTFSTSFEKDMTYSLAWGLFAFGLLTVGFRTRNAPTRYAGMALLAVTLVKLFLHDLWRLGGLYRIASLIGLAVLLIVVSFIYQRFFSSAAAKKSAEPAAPIP